MTNEQIIRKLSAGEKPEFSKMQVLYLQDKIINSITYPIYLLEKGSEEGRIKTKDIETVFECLNGLVKWIRGL
ncbi:MAG: hypothetical protein DDT22_00250 [candidate division WS2 bacterium]|nr:hypothetical protein [Bacillota bacterium]MBT9174590.1 hypothetical protein [Candidatus Lithacetigena glycinireducens]